VESKNAMHEMFQDIQKAHNVWDVRHSVAVHQTGSTISTQKQMNSLLRTCHEQLNSVINDRNLSLLFHNANTLPTGQH
jgi:hypothetical protein